MHDQISAVGRSTRHAAYPVIPDGDFQAGGVQGVFPPVGRPPSAAAAPTPAPAADRHCQHLGTRLPLCADLGDAPLCRQRRLPVGRARGMLSFLRPAGDHAQGYAFEGERLLTSTAPPDACLRTSSGSRELQQWDQPARHVPGLDRLPSERHVPGLHNSDVVATSP